MGKKIVDNTEEYLTNLKACINCLKFEECEKPLSFPNDLSECCYNWIKKE